MTTTLRLITAPSTEPVTLTETKLYLRVDHTADDTLITSLIAAAREKGEELSRRAFISQTLELTMDTFSKVTKLYRPPLITVTSVKYLDASNAEHTWTDYVTNKNAEPGVIVYNSFPNDTLLDQGAVTIRYTAGYGTSASDVPGRIKNALLALIAYWYENREQHDVPAGIAAEFIGERAVWF